MVAKSMVIKGRVVNPAGVRGGLRGVSVTRVRSSQGGLTAAQKSAEA